MNILVVLDVSLCIQSEPMNLLPFRPVRLQGSSDDHKLGPGRLLGCRVEPEGEEMAGNEEPGDTGAVADNCDINANS